MLGWAQGLALVLQEGCCGDTRLSPRYGVPDPLMLFSLPPPDTLPSDPLQPQQDSWLSLVDKLNVKAFVSLTLAPSVRHGVRQLLFTSGLGEWCPGWAWVRVHPTVPAG